MTKSVVFFITTPNHRPIMLDGWLCEVLGPFPTIECAERFAEKHLPKGLEILILSGVAGLALGDFTLAGE